MGHRFKSYCGSFGMIAQQVERPVEARIAEVRFLLVPLADIFGKALPLISLTGNNYRTGQCAFAKAGICTYDVSG